MHFSLIAAFFVSVLPLALANGGFSLSCTDIQANLNANAPELSATCMRGNNSLPPTRSTVQLNSCLHNDDGFVKCGGSNFMSSCFYGPGCKLLNNAMGHPTVLQCSCMTNNGVLRASRVSFDLNECYGNVDGQLKC
ncbi:Cyanovirin-N [Exidia glandulosa HHB12029]|uniref:Cyanovirin-N n=1 Tax=Exidia glandulosa HHB12029 TaxID=1314781 RepID=A0A165P413_EXIGL|nr:Cyanovirin-N [Exidia glandulosa HHB12029]